MDIEKLVCAQREYFNTGETIDIEFRKRALTALEHALKSWEGRIIEALKKDLNKSAFEAYMCEIGLTLYEITDEKKDIRKGKKKKRVRTPPTK